MTQRIYNTSKWRRIRLEVLARDHHLCQIALDGVCIGQAEVVDHVIPIVAGGDPFDLENLRAACRACNSTLGGIVGQRRREMLVEGEPCPTCGHIVGTTPIPRRLGRPAIGSSGDHYV